MHIEEIKRLFKAASVDELVAAFTKAEEYKKKSHSLSFQHDSIMDRITKGVSDKFKHIQPLTYEVTRNQIQDLNKHWRYMAASMIKVQRTIALPGFHSDMNLYLNSRYGVKEHKRYCGWSPFQSYGFEHNLDREPAYSFVSDRLRIVDNFNSTAGTIDFVTLHGIPQIDSNKARFLSLITKDMVDMIDSWRIFYNTRDRDIMDEIKLLENTERGYNIRDNKMYLAALRKSDNRLAYKQQLLIDIQAVADKWTPVIDKWKEHNKNFLVLSELAKIDLNI